MPPSAQAARLGAYKLARYAYSRLSGMVLAPAVQEEVELSSLLIRCMPMVDAEELLPLCYRCQATNPLLNTQVSGSAGWAGRGRVKLGRAGWGQRGQGWDEAG
jgi:hypothetical protein